MKIPEMSSMSEASPVKSSSDDSKRSSNTTSVPDISSFSTASSNSSTVSEFKKRIQLLKIQLAQREKEVTREKWEKDGAVMAQKKTTSELAHLQLKSDALSAICEDLLEWVQTNEAEELRRNKELENIYKNNLKGISLTATSLKSANGVLKEKLSATEAKISSIVHENNYLRWESDSLKRQVDALKSDMEMCSRDRAQLKTESARLEGEIRKITRAHKDRTEKELNTVVISTATKMEKVRRVHDDREKEYGITLTRMQNEIDFLKSELVRKEAQIGRLTELADQLTLDNRKLYILNAEQRDQHDTKVVALKQEVTRLQQDVEDMNRQNKKLRSMRSQLEKGIKDREGEEYHTKILIHNKDEDLQRAQSQIQVLQKQVSELSVQSELASSDIRMQLKKKSVRLIELEEQLRCMEKECVEEREQRENSTILLAEMGKDMRMLIDVMKNAE